MAKGGDSRLGLRDLESYRSSKIVRRQKAKPGANAGVKFFKGDKASGLQVGNSLSNRHVVFSLLQLGKRLFVHQEIDSLTLIVLDADRTDAVVERLPLFRS